MNSRSLTLFAVTLLLATAFVPTPVAGQDDGEAERDRRVEVSSGEERVEISLLPRGDGGEDEPVNVRFATGNATLTLAHGSGAPALELQLRMGPLVEFEDQNGNGSYDPGEPLASAWALAGEAEDDEDVNGTARWGAPIVTNATRGEDAGRRVTVPAELGEGASINLGLTAFGSHAQLPNTTLTPTGAKLDLAIAGYPYQGNNTMLALLVQAEASEAREINRQHESFARVEQGVVVTPEGEPAALMIAWRDTARVDGQLRPVTTSEMDPGAEDTPGVYQPEVDPNVTQRQLALGYDRGNRIVHDFRTDVALGAETQEDAPGPRFLAALAAIGVASALRRRTLP